MPFAASIMTDEEDKKNKEQNGGVNVSGQSTSFSTGLPGQEGSGSGEKTKGSGDKFANIQSYLDVNQSQGNEMGQKIAGDVSAKADDATQKVQTFESKAPTVAAYDPNDAYNNVTSLTDQQKKAYQDAKAGYKGPASLDAVDGYQDTQKAISTAATGVKNAGTEEGQRQLLKDTYKKPSYTAGQNALDQTIVQNSSDSRKGFEDLTQKYSGLNSLFDTAANTVGTKVNEAQKTALANQQAIAQGDVAAKKALMDPIAARAAQMTKDNLGRISSVSNDIYDDILSEDTLKALGLSDGQNLWDLSLSNYITPDRTQVGINNAANADERARYAALTALIDGQAGSDITADGAAINPLAFDRARFDADLAKKQAAFDQYAQGANIGGSAGENRDGYNIGAAANANLADYLRTGNINVSDTSDRFAQMVRDYDPIRASFSEQAKQNALAQIQAALDAQKYNRRIKKG